MSYIEQISFPKEQVDAFARLRVSNPTTIFDSKLIYDNAPLTWDDSEVSGSGTSSTYNTNQASVTLSVGNLTAGKRARQTKRWFNYQPGKSQLIFFTGIIGASATGITSRIGLFNDENGLFFDSSPANIGVNIRSYVTGVAVDSRVDQSNWNLDIMDGSGTSGITLDFSKTQIFFVDLEWLGVGSVRFGFVVDGKPIYVHQFDHANSSTTVWASTPNLPVRYEIENDGTGAAADLLHICSSVISEGGVQENGFPVGLSRLSTPLITGNNPLIYPVFAMRLKTGYFGTTVSVNSFSINCTSNAAYNWFFLLNPTVTGTAFTFTGLTSSAVEADSGTTNATTVSGGFLLATGSDTQGNSTSANRGDFRSDFALGTDIAGNKDVLVLAVQRVTGSAETFFAGLNWSEQK